MFTVKWFFCDLRVLVRKLAMQSVHTTQGMSLRKFNLSLFAIPFGQGFKCVYPIRIDFLVVSSFADEMDYLGFSKVVSTMAMKFRD